MYHKSTVTFSCARDRGTKNEKVTVSRPKCGQKYSLDKNLWIIYSNRGQLINQDTISRSLCVQINLGVTSYYLFLCRSYKGVMVEENMQSNQVCSFVNKIQFVVIQLNIYNFFGIRTHTCNK